MTSKQIEDKRSEVLSEYDKLRDSLPYLEVSPDVRKSINGYFDMLEASQDEVAIRLLKFTIAVVICIFLFACMLGLIYYLSKGI